MADWQKQVTLTKVDGQWSAEFKNRQDETIVTPKDIRQIMVTLRVSHRKLLAAFRIEQRRAMEAPAVAAGSAKPAEKKKRAKTENE